MNILLAHKYFYRGGGTATYVFALIEELKKPRWVTLLVAALGILFQDRLKL